MEERNPCPSCGSVAEPVLQLEATGLHYARLVCGGCKRYIKFVGKPDELKVKRPAIHRDLVEKYSKGYCELCLRRKEELRKGQTLEAQHVIEFKDGGTEVRDNIWVVCTPCHKFIHHIRTYHGHDKLIEQMERAS